MVHLIEKFTDHLKKGRYNQVTIKSYRDAIFLFYNKYRDFPQHKFDENLIASYLKELESQRGYTTEQVVQTGKALKMFFQVIFDKTLNIKASGDKKEKLPDFLTQQEVKLILEKASNLKHKTILTLVYGWGLKLNEVINLNVSDFDFEKNIVVILSSDEKEHSSRTLKISPKMRGTIDEYFQKYKPTTILFEGNQGKAYSSRAVQLFFGNLIEDVGIKKNITIQSLRHSFAVHLLEIGVDIHHLQKILGHKYLQTTTLYQQYFDFKLHNVPSPIEFLD